MGAIAALLRAVPPVWPRWAAGGTLAVAGAAAGLLLFGLAGGAALGATAALVWLRLLAPARAGLRWAERIATHDATFRHLAAVRLWLFRRVAAIAPARFERMRAGDLLNRMTADIDALDALHLRALVPGLVGGAALIGTAALLIATVDALLGAIVTLGGLVAFALVPPVAARRAADAGTAIAGTTALLRGRLVEGLRGQAELAVYRGGDAFAGEIAGIEAQLAAARRRAARATAGGAAMSGATAQLTVAGLLGLGLAGAAGGPIVLVVAILVAIALFEVLAPAGGALVAFQGATAAARRLLDLAPGPEHERRTAPGDQRSPFRARAGAIALDGVTFAHAEDRPPVLAAASLRIAPGETVLLEGTSGIGKSTLAMLILRLRDPAAGTIAVDGQDLRDVDPERIWAGFTVLPQRFALFAGSLREALALGAPDAGDDTLWAALGAVALADWARGLPDGLDTWLGEAGQKVSGGQARRIALARALLRDRPYAILDEPTDGLDAVTEAAIVDTLDRWRRGRTVLIIGHRPALRGAADRVVTLEGGRFADRSGD